MKNLFLSIVFLACFQSGFGQANTYVAPKNDILPVFDGDTIDNSWQFAKWKNIDQPWIPYNNVLSGSDPAGTKTISGTADFSGRYKMQWSETDSLLLFLVEIHDDVFIDGYDPATLSGNYPNYDVVEIFIDEDHSGGNHLFDSGGNNAENAFAYHMNVNAPTVGGITTTLAGAMDLYGTSFSNVINYKAHFPMYSMKNYGGGRYVYEFALRIYKDTYDNSNPFVSRRALSLNDNMGLSIAYCDNDENDNTRNHFIGSVTVSGANANNSYIDASIFGTLLLKNQDYIAPMIPLNLTITNSTLSWSLSTDNVSVLGYNLYQNNVFLTSLTGLTYTLPGYTPPGSPYAYKVQAFDAAGNISDFSDFIIYTPAKPQLTASYVKMSEGYLINDRFTIAGINLVDTVYIKNKFFDCTEVSKDSLSLGERPNSVSGIGNPLLLIPNNGILQPTSLYEVLTCIYDVFCPLSIQETFYTTIDTIIVYSKYADTVQILKKTTYIGCTSKIDDQIQLLKMYPNPANEVLNIDLQKSATIIITDIIGNTVFSSSLPEGHQTIDLHSLKKGYYLINIQQPNQPKLVKPIIKE